jgi:hypothetical protein
MLHASEVGRTLRTLVLVAVFVLLPHWAWAQWPSNVANVNLAASLTESLSVSAGAGPVNFTLVPNGIAPGSAPVAIQTSWVLKPSRTAVTLVGYFDSVNALTDAGPPVANIDVANVEGRVATGTPTTFTAFTQSPTVGIGTAGASLELFSETIIGNNKQKTRTDNLELRINLTGPVQQPAGNYTGILRIQAIAN